MNIPHLVPIPEDLIKEAQTIIRDAIFAMMENRLDKLHGVTAEVPEHPPIMGKIAGAAALYGFTIKDVHFLQKPTVVEILFNETDMALKVVF